MRPTALRKRKPSIKAKEALRQSNSEMQSLRQLAKQLPDFRFVEFGISNERTRRLDPRNPDICSGTPQGSSSKKAQTISKTGPQRQALIFEPTKSGQRADSGSTKSSYSNGMLSDASQKTITNPSEASDSDLDDVYIRCICGITEEDPFHAMICCDTCTAWQHNTCMGFSEVEEELPQKYYCEMCRPQDHRKTLEALKCGEHIWVTRFEETWESRVMTGFRNKIQA